jgi:hypothetical protein
MLKVGNQTIFWDFSEKQIPKSQIRSQKSTSQFFRNAVQFSWPWASGQKIINREGGFARPKETVLHSWRQIEDSRIENQAIHKDTGYVLRYFEPRQPLKAGR